MLKKTFYLTFTLIILCLIMNIQLVNAGPQYCSTINGYDYYVINAYQPRNPTIYYADVQRSDGEVYTYVFKWSPKNKTYMYKFSFLNSLRDILGSGLITNDQLANDIFYVTRKIVED